MIMKFLSQIILSTLLLQMFPVDAADVQHLATLPESKYVTPSMYNAFSLPSVTIEQANATDGGPIKMKPMSLGVVTSAVSAIVVDRKTMRVLFQKNSDAPRSIGSITKLMTALVFLQTNPVLSAPAKLKSEDFRSGAVQHLAFEDEVSVKDLLYASLISSDNSATASLVRLSGMSVGDFVAKMNETAAGMGMIQTTFVDPTGLSSKNESVVFDLVKLLDRAAANEVIRDATKHSTFTITGKSGRGYQLKSTDKLLESFLHQDPYRIVAAKTGFLPEAGYCLGSIFSRNDIEEVIVVVLGSQSNPERFQDVKSLVVWTYETFKW